MLVVNDANRRHLRWWWAWAGLWWMTGDGSAHVAELGVTAAAALDALYEEYFETRLRRYPSSATFNGNHRYDQQLENPARPAFEAESRELQRSFLARARAINTDTLSAAQRLSYEIFVSDRELSLKRLSFPDRMLPIDQMNSMASTFALLGSGESAQAFNTVADYDAFLARSEAFTLWADAAIDAMREGLARGVVNPRIIMAQLRDIAREQPEQTLFWLPVAKLPAAIAATERAHHAGLSALGRFYRARLPANDAHSPAQLIGGFLALKEQVNSALPRLFKAVPR